MNKTTTEETATKAAQELRALDYELKTLSADAVMPVLASGRAPLLLSILILSLIWRLFL